ncbi:PPE domain-containing protein [Saccharopolyspora hordei]
MAFDHPKIYGEVESGPGVAAASRAAANWREQVSATFGEADADLDQVLKKFDVVMEGAAGEQAKTAVTPLAQDTRQSVEVAAQVGAVIEQQAQGSADFKHKFPPPHQVPPDNIGWMDYVNPISYGTKTGVRAAHEEIHAKVDTQAREQYTAYTQDSNGRVNTVQHFAPPPRFDADVTPAATTPVSKVDQPSTGYTSTSTMPSGQSQVSHASSTPSPSTPTPTGHSPVNPVSPTPAAPAESGSAWATPPAAGGAPLPGTAVPTPAPAGGGLVGGAVIPPSGSGTGTPAPGTGGRTGTGVGTGTGRGVTPGPGAGVRGGPGAGVLGGGGRSGTGVPGTTGSATAAGGSAARGGPGGPGGVAGAAGRGRGEGEEDKDHENKYVEENSELFEDLGLPKTAPPVFGDWGNDPGLPPRPPERK